MAIYIKNQSQIKKMYVAGQIVAKTFELIEKQLKSGMTTGQINAIAEEYILGQNATPSFKTKGFPATACISVNDEVIHGLPGNRILKDGDIVSIDLGACIDGFHGDAARTYGIGTISEEDERLMNVTKQSFYEGIAFAKENHHLNEICTAIERYVVKNGYHVVKEFTGHGIGEDLHEEPQIPNYDMKRKGIRLRKGLALAIEPMVTADLPLIRIKNDNWTVVTQNGARSAHYENTIVITDGEPFILTL